MELMLAAATGHGAGTLLALLVMLVAAKLMAELFERLRQPATVGEILAGVIIGPGALALVAPTEVTNTLAEIGVIFLLFTVGLETKPASVFRVGTTAALVAILGIIVPFAGGWALMRVWGATNVEALFIGTAMVATSVGITARVLSGMGLLSTRTARIILGAAVIDDILGLLVLAVVSSVAAGEVDYLEIATTAVLAVTFTAFIVLIGSRVITRIAPRIENLRLQDSTFVFGLVLCLGLSVAVSFIGVAGLIGAFLAGMAMAEATEGNHEMHRQTAGVTEFLVPFFLVNIGMQLDLSVFRDSSVIALSLAVTLVAVATKFVACGVGAINFGWLRAGRIGMGMVPRGEVGIVVAQIGLTLGVVTDQLYAVVLFMAVATTLIAPPFLKLLYAPGTAPAPEPSETEGELTVEGDFCRLG